MAHDPRDPDRTEFTGPIESVVPGDAADPATLLGSRIGPYLLVEALGVGGMGEVFLAEQAEPIRRRVALKLVRRQIVDALSLAYFEIERQALARMEHPAIARVYDAGRTAEGYPYFAMEYVEGVTLGRWHAQDRPALATTLRVFVALVRGVAHAHQRGIVHRDLKPDNVLVTVVDGLAQPKLIDFGIAIGIDDAGGTGTVNRAGSVDYMSPEQFASDHAAIDARSDVYSLGRILLGLLVPSLRVRGEPTQRPTELHARLRASLAGARDADLSSVPGELRHLLARALAPDREQRYDSASAFADDVQRYLDGRPLRAVPASNTYALRKFVGRNRASVSLAAGVVLAILAGLGATLWSLHEAEREAERARATSAFLSTILSSVDPAVARDLDKTLLRKVLDEAARRVERELGGQPEVRADIEGAIIASYLGLGDVQVALDKAQAAHAWARDAFGSGHPSTLKLALQNADALRVDGKLAEAETMARDAIGTAARKLGEHDETTLRLHHMLGITLRDLGRTDEAIVELQLAIDGLSATLGADANPTVDARFALAITFADKDRFDEAIPMLAELIEQQGALKGMDQTSVLTMRNSLAVFHLQARRYADGERLLKALLEPSAKQYGEDNFQTLMIHGNLGGALRQQGKVEEAGPHYLRAMEGNRKLFGTDHPRSLMTLHNYGNWLLDAGRIAEADATQSEALATADRVFKEPHPTKAEIITSLGKVRTRQARYDEAEKLLLQSIELKTALRGPGNSRLFQSREALRELYAAWGKPELVARYAEVEKVPDAK
jgi:tetratricopeptide (TPR) repeat protein